jgi:hypothetical protein
VKEKNVVEAQEKKKDSIRPKNSWEEVKRNCLEVSPIVDFLIGDV